MRFDVVVAADLDWGIGKSQGLPWPKLRGDLQHFKRITSAALEGKRNAIVMGRKTWESKEVGGKPLPKRLNVVVSRKIIEVPDGVILAHSVDDAMIACATAGDVETTFVIGGAGLFQDAIGHAALRYVYLTRVEGRFQCDVAMPDLDVRGFVRVAWEGEQTSEDNDVRYRIERLTLR